MKNTTPATRRTTEAREVLSMDLKIDLPNVYKRYAPRLTTITVHQAAWIVENDPFLSETDIEILRAYAGTATPYANDSEVFLHRPHERMLYVSCNACECMTMRCKCGACSVCTYVLRDFEECASCTTQIARAIDEATTDSPQLFGADAESSKTHVCVACGFRALLCDSCEECTRCSDNACGKCVTKCEEHCDHLKCTSCNEYVDDPLCARCAECNECCDCEHCDRCGDPCESTCSRCNRCEDDCSCAICDRCNQPLEYTCSDCGCCDNHCACVRCQDCGCAIDTDSDDYCGSCGRCDGCGHARNCENGEGDAGEEIELEGDEFNATHVRYRRTFDSTRLAGVEVEYNRCDNFKPIADWRRKWKAAHHEDGSCGFECVTAPASGDFLVNQITELTSAMKSAGATIDRCCGIHVHVDARDLKWHDIYRLVKVYAKVETALYLIAGQHRSVRPSKQDGTHYCKPNGATLLDGIRNGEFDPAEKKHHLLSAIYDGNGSAIAREKPDKKDGKRYVGLNLCPWVSGRAHRTVQGAWDYAKNRYKMRYVHEPMPDTTIEFRMHRDSLDGARIAGWAKLCVRLVEYAARATDREIENLPSSGMRALCVIAPDLKSWIVGRLKSWRRHIPRSKRRVNYVSIGRDGALNRVRSYVFCAPQVDGAYTEEMAA